jgi:hypothetical protein
MRVKVYAVYKEGVKTYFKYKDMLGLPHLDGVIDVSWQRNAPNPEVIVLRRPIQPGDKILLIDHSAVSGETLYSIMRRFPGVNFVTAAEVADYYGAFYLDYMIVDGALKRVAGITERYVDLGDERVEFAFGPEDFMVLDRDERVDRRVRVVESYEKRKPIVFRQNPVYLILNSDVMFERPRLVAEAIGYERVGPPGRFFACENFRERWSPSLARAVCRAVRVRAERGGGVAKPVMYAVEAGGVYIPVGFDPVYPVVYGLGLPAYIKRARSEVPVSEVLDAERLFGDANDIGIGI